MDLENKSQTEVKVDSASDGDFAYEVGDTIQPIKGGTRNDVKDMSRMGKNQELRVWPRSHEPADRTMY